MFHYIDWLRCNEHLSAIQMIDGTFCNDYALTRFICKFSNIKADNANYDEPRLPDKPDSEYCCLFSPMETV